MAHGSFLISSLADKEFIYREQKGSVILRDVESNTSTVLIEGKKIVSTLRDDQDEFRGVSCGKRRSVSTFSTSTQKQ